MGFTEGALIDDGTRFVFGGVDSATGEDGVHEEVGGSSPEEGGDEVVERDVSNQEDLIPVLVAYSLHCPLDLLLGLVYWLLSRCRLLLQVFLCEKGFFHVD